MRASHSKLEIIILLCRSMNKGTIRAIVDCEESMTLPSNEPATEIAQPPAAPPSPAPETFKCEKCGATFEDEGSAAAHIQGCKGIDPVSENMPQKA